VILTFTPVTPKLSTRNGWDDLIDLLLDTWGGGRHYRFSENERFLVHFAIYCKTLESSQITALEVGSICFSFLQASNLMGLDSQMLAYLREHLGFEVSRIHLC